jgi:hypothetical protein
MKPQSVLFTLALLTFVSCASLSGAPYHVSTERDQFRGTTTYRMLGNLTPGSGAGIDLNALKHETPDATTYALFVRTTNVRGWLFVGDGQSLSVMADGAVMEFHTAPDGIRREVLGGGITREYVVYPIAEADLRRIAAAQAVRLRLYGERPVERELSASNVANLARFVREHLP